MAHRDFTFTAPMQDDAPSFSIAGHEFKCLTQPPPGYLLDVVAAASSEVDVQVSAVTSFIEGCLPESSVEEWRLVIHDKDTIIPLATLVEIVSWLVETYGQRPTTPPSDSQPGASVTVGTSEGGSSSQAPE